MERYKKLLMTPKNYFSKMRLSLDVSWISLYSVSVILLFIFNYRELFLSEHSKLTRKYGRYCINYAHSINLIKIYIKYFSIYQFKNKLQLRIDGMLIKPIQRLTRYNFIKSIMNVVIQDYFCQISHVLDFFISML